MLSSWVCILVVVVVLQSHKIAVWRNFIALQADSSVWLSMQPACWSQFTRFGLFRSPILLRDYFKQANKLPGKRIGILISPSGKRTPGREPNSAPAAIDDQSSRYVSSILGRQKQGSNLSRRQRRPALGGRRRATWDRRANRRGCSARCMHTIIQFREELVVYSTEEILIAGGGR